MLRISGYVESEKRLIGLREEFAFVYNFPLVAAAGAVPEFSDGWAGPGASSWPTTPKIICLFCFPHFPPLAAPNHPQNFPKTSPTPLQIDPRQTPNRPQTDPGPTPERP